MKLKSTVNTWWKIVLIVVGVVFVVPAIIGTIHIMVVGMPVGQATADNAVKACRSSDYGPSDELLGSRSSVKPDGTWTPNEVAPGAFQMIQHVRKDSAFGTSYADLWICRASMAKDGLWTVTWTSGSSYQMAWYVKDAELRTVAMPRDLSGPGYGG